MHLRSRLDVGRERGLSAPAGAATQSFGRETGTTVASVLGELEHRALTGRARFESDIAEAEVDFISGKIVDAFCGDVVGLSAVRLLLGVADGRYEVTELPIESRPPLAPDVATVVADREQRLAEWKTLCESAPPLGTRLNVTDAGRAALKAEELPKDELKLLKLINGKRTLTDIIDECNLDAVDALRGIMKLLAEGRITEQTLRTPMVDVVAEPKAPMSPMEAVPAQVTGKALRRKTVIGIGVQIPDAPEKKGGDRAEVRRIINVTTAPPSVGPPTPVMPRRRSQAPLPPPVLGARSEPTTGEAAGSIRKGPRFVGRYEVLGRIGFGGMGSVYLCRITSEVGFRRLFALKILRSHLLTDAAAAEKFLAEARLAGHMHHPNIVSVVDAGFDGPQPYLVMDYVEGASLKQLLNADSTRRPELIVPVLLEALAGLHAAHTLESDDGRPLQIVHCDVSAENLMIGVDGVCRLTDFGVARHGEPYRDQQMALGKPSCMAPEQLTGGRVDRRADIFAMGVILYNSLTGTTLFAAETVEETVRNVCNVPIPPPSTVGVMPPAGFDHIAMRALERDPNRRYSTAEEMLTELRRVAIRENLLAPPSMVAEWVRQCVGPELAQRRLSMLDASRRARSDASREANDGFAGTPFEVAEGPPSQIDPHGISQTVFLEVGPPRRHWPLMIAGILAMAVVLTTLLWPGLVSRIFNVKTNAVISKELELPPVPSGADAPGTPSANPTLESSDAQRPSRP